MMNGNKIKGFITKGIGGFYDVKSSDFNETLQCSLRGLLRIKGVTPAIGDKVIVNKEEDGHYVIEEIEERSNYFVRPPVANVDTAVLVFSVNNPPPNMEVLTKLLVQCEYNEVEVILCFTKVDLATEKNINKMKNYLYATDYPVFLLGFNEKRQSVVDEIKERLVGKISFLAGPSGTGKSTLINAMIPEAQMEIGEISKKALRGRHTTRHVELIPLGAGGAVVDTPGFTSIELGAFIERDILKYYFKEFDNDGCKFNDCVHLNEPRCAVKKQLERSEISSQRYHAYLELLKKTENKY